MSVVPSSDDGSVTEGSIFDQWGKVSLEAGDKFGKDLRIHQQIKGYLEDAGFEDVVEHVYKWPMGPWSKDPQLKEIGMWNQLHWLEGIEGWSLALLTRVLGVEFPYHYLPFLLADCELCSGLIPRCRCILGRCDRL
jgi:hypothetical protein